jgi:hypothetical protein
VQLPGVPPHTSPGVGHVPPHAWSVGSPQAGGDGVVLLVVEGGPGVVVVVLPQAPVQDWKSEAQVAASDCAVDAHPWRQDSRSDAVRHPVTHVFASAATLRAHVPRFSPQVPRHAAVEGSADEGDGGLHAWTQLGTPLRQVVCEDRNVSVQLRMQEPTSAGAEFVRQSIRQLDRVMRAALRQVTFSAPQPAGHGWLAAWAVTASSAPRPTRLHSNFEDDFMGPPFGSILPFWAESKDCSGCALAQAPPVLRLRG